MMNEHMDKKVSIVIVSHDLHEYLEKCLISIEEHTERDLIADLVIVDNGSRNNTALQTLTALTSFPVVPYPFGTEHLLCPC